MWKVCERANDLLFVLDASWCVHDVEFNRRVLVKMVGWVRANGLCASLLGLATLSASVSPQLQYLPPLKPASSVTPLCAMSTTVVTRYVTTIKTQWITTTLSPSMESSHFLGYLPPAPDDQACPTTITVTSESYPSRGGFVTPMPSLVTPYEPVTSQNIVITPCRCDACSYVVRTDPCECAEEFGCGAEPLLFKETPNE
ncbi:uncharacterized protein LOC125036427 [Penaeus chinensis]|uniref:uncharacterized protein LOC125036427 n=1 Tax=Penaeus chinensis TaxID=139456 RepID=UPI001FB7D42A|nr:uncharacterized protein LOC125036427 [Penaeus chinensis]